LPHHRLKEALELFSGLDGVEVELHDDVPVIVNRLVDALSGHPGVATSVSELVERPKPGAEIRDRMLNMKRCQRHLPAVRDVLDNRDAIVARQA
jgi:hypothetical protein